MRIDYDSLSDERYGIGNYNKKPFQFIDHGSEKEVKDWLVQDIAEKTERAHKRIEKYRAYDALYKGLHYYAVTGEEKIVGTKTPKVFVNFFHEMVEAKVAQRARVKPSIAVIPNNDETSDENTAKASEKMLKSRAQEINLDGIITDSDRTEFLRGESYLHICWDAKNKIHPEWLKAKKEGVPLPAELQNPSMQGDVMIKIIPPERCFPQMMKKHWCEVDDISVIDFCHIEELKAKYPANADQIKAKGTSLNNHYEYLLESDLEERGYVTVVTYWHRKTPYLPDGAKIVYCGDVLLEQGPLGYEHGKLPFIFNTDIDVIDELHGRPFVSNIAHLQNLHNMIMTSMARSIAVASAPKWVYPKGSVHVSKLGNEYGALEFSGPMAPQLVAYNGVSNDMITAPEIIERHITKQSGVYDISRGEPPKGVKAAVALQFLDEQELQRETRGIAKRHRKIVDTYKMMLEVMAQYYKQDEQRMIKIVGEDNSYILDSFNKSDVSSSYDIRVLNSSALPDSKTGKIAAIIDLNMATQTDPLFGKEEVAAMLDLGNDERFKDKASVGVKSAKTKVERIISGQDVGEPKEWDDLIVEYPIFVKALQERTFKKTDESVIAVLKDYIFTMEFLMDQKAKANPLFAQKIMMFQTYPIFFQPMDSDVLLAKQQQAMMGGAPAPMPQGGIDLKPVSETNNRNQKAMGETQPIAEEGAI